MEYYGYPGDMSVRLANYRYVEEANKDGIDLSKMKDELEKVRKELEEVKKQQTSKPTPELFAIQERLVGSDKDVMDAFEIKEEAKLSAMKRMLQMDSEYKLAEESYIKTVNDAYVRYLKAKQQITNEPQA